MSGTGRLGQASATFKLVLLGTALAVVGLAIFAGVSVSGGNGPARVGGAVRTTPTTSAAETRAQLLAHVTTAPTNGETEMSTDSAVAVQTTSGHLASVVVETYPSGARLRGGFNAAGDVWLAKGRLRPNTTYRLMYKVEGNGVTATGSGKFSTGPVPVIQMSMGAATPNTVASGGAGASAPSGAAPVTSI